MYFSFHENFQFFCINILKSKNCIEVGASFRGNTSFVDRRGSLYNGMNLVAYTLQRVTIVSSDCHSVAYNCLCVHSNLTQQVHEIRVAGLSFAILEVTLWSRK